MTDFIRNIFNESGISEVGFCDFAPFSDKLLPCAAAKRIPENAQSVIVCLLPYKVKQTPPKNLSRYAAVPDYHGIGAKILTAATEKLKQKYTDNNFEIFLDNSPLPEVSVAVRAGLGVVGKNGLLINEKYGSFVFIGEIITDLKINCTPHPQRECINCGKCIIACPVGCDKSRCLSDISQKKGELTEAEKKHLKGHNILWGCDICAEVCPMNKNKELTNIKDFILGYRDTYTPDEDATDRPYNWRGKKTIKRNFDNLK